MQGGSRVARQATAVVVAVAAAVVGCGGKDSDSGSGWAAPGSGAGSADDEALSTQRETLADAVYIVLRDQGLVAIEDYQFRTIVEDKYVGGRAIVRPGGGLWVYVGDRLARYDGELTPLPDAPAKLGAVAVGPDGTLWASGAGLASYDGKTWKRHALPSTLRDSFVRSLVFAADGARYGVADGVLVAGRGDTWTALTVGSPPVRDVALAGDGTIYVSLRDQVARLAHDKLVPIATMKGDSPSLVTASDGTVHVFGRAGAHRLAAGKLEPLAELPFTVGQVFGADGTLYGIPTDGMRIVRRRADGAVDQLPADKDLPFKARSITVDTANRLWLVLEHGMAILDTAPPCSSAPRSSATRGARRARVWLCDEDRLTLLMPGEVPGLSRDVEAIIVTGRGPHPYLFNVDAFKQLTKFTSAITSAEKLTLHEGLPHPTLERALVEAERRSKPVWELHRDWFYKEPLAPSAEDMKRLTQLLSTPAMFTPIVVHTACCQFHSDYAIEWQQGSSVYRALLCFGCGQARLFGPGLDGHYDLDRDARRELEALLWSYRKNRPPPWNLCELLFRPDWALVGALHWPTRLIARDPWELFVFVLGCAQHLERASR